MAYRILVKPLVFRQWLLTQTPAIPSGGCKEGLSERLAQEGGLDELECTKWWYQWLGQALLIMAEWLVVLV